MLVSLAQAGDQRALAALVQRFRPMSWSIGHSKGTIAFPAEDVASLCVETFIRTLPSYDPAKSELASFWYSKASLAIADHYRSISRIGRNNGQLSAAYFAEVTEARERYGKSFIDHAEFAQRHGVAESRVRRIALAGGAVVSTDLAVGAEGNATIGDMLASDAVSPAVLVEQGSTMAFIQEKLSTLGANERNVVERYFGLNGYAPENFPSIGERLGVTYQRAQQIFRGAIETMRQRVQNLDKQAVHPVKAPPHMLPAKKPVARRRRARASALAAA